MTGLVKSGQQEVRAQLVTGDEWGVSWCGKGCIQNAITQTTLYMYYTNKTRNYDNAPFSVGSGTKTGCTPPVEMVHSGAFSY